MRENHIDMWIVAVKEGHDDPMAAMLGEGEPGAQGPNFYIFHGSGAAAHRACRASRSPPRCWRIGPSYDLHISRKDLQAFVAERHPQRIAVDMSDEMGTADGLSYTEYNYLTKTIGEALRGSARFCRDPDLAVPFTPRTGGDRCLCTGRLALPGAG